MEVNRAIFKILTTQGFFSEYLPPCFYLDERCLNGIPPLDCDIIKPFCFTMSKYTNNESRRNIYIPEVGSYLVAQNYMFEQGIIEELINFTNEENYSFSPAVNNRGEIYKFELSYGEVGEDVDEWVEINTDYIQNVADKIIRATGAKKILKMDLASFYASIYTHFFPSIVLSLETANQEYKKTLKNDPSIHINSTYKKYAELDKVIRNQNLQQTNGILPGPFSSRLLSEALLTRIDKELKEEGFNFVRYVDDYEIFIFDEDVESVKSKFNHIFNKYNLSVNSEKVCEEPFPYYVNKNLKKIYDDYYGNYFTDDKLMDLFNTFFDLENHGIKGAIRFLLKSIYNKPLNITNSQLLKSYLLSIIQNNKRSLIKACQIIINRDPESFSIEERDIIFIKNVLHKHIQKNHDLEVIWLLYLLLSITTLSNTDDIITAICSSNNELAQALLLAKNLIPDTEKQTIIDKADSWILNYELYYSSFISEDEFKDRLCLSKNLSMYNRFKNSGIHFIKIE